MKIEAVLARIPYLGVHQLEVERSDHEEVRIGMKRTEALSNHVGIFHAGALFTVAETATGVAAWGVVPDDAAYVLLRGAEIHYTRRAEGDVVAVARVADGAASAARDAFAASSRADAAVEVTVLDSSGETVFRGTFDYALRPRRP